MGRWPGQRGSSHIAAHVLYHSAFGLPCRSKDSQEGGIGLLPMPYHSLKIAIASQTPHLGCEFSLLIEDPIFCRNSCHQDQSNKTDRGLHPPWCDSSPSSWVWLILASCTPSSFLSFSLPPALQTRRSNIRCRDHRLRH